LGGQKAGYSEKERKEKKREETIHTLDNTSLQISHASELRQFDITGKVLEEEICLCSSYTRVASFACRRTTL
jgi:hypothetical protein